MAEYFYNQSNRKTMNYFIDHNKSATASCIIWISDEYDIKDLTPYIESILCDNGEDYIELYGDDFEQISIDNFEAIAGDDENSYILCYTAIVKINFDDHIDFKNAMESSGNMVEVKVGFKDTDGEELDDLFEENYDNAVELEEDE